MTRTAADVWVTALAIMGHKGAEAVALGSAFLKARPPRWLLLTSLSAFVAATPLGVLVGAFIAEGGSAVSGVLNALAVGVILYACIEMLAEFEAKARLRRRLLRCFAFLCGLGLLFGLDLLHAPVCQHQHRSSSSRSSSSGCSGCHELLHAKAFSPAAAAAAAAGGAAAAAHHHHHHHHHHRSHEAGLQQLLPRRQLQQLQQQQQQGPGFLTGAASSSSSSVSTLRGLPSP
ncbi:ZIP Zinc transporter domain-containing protein, putative [Eimeria tenella]|uniref:ZIP Zinc transporter domain-containing protein, putative n=1 Tax=Eimeria tenella TaxID=5802 RepID=U6KZP4_EIMTE|nr:ZIP Zinc transporter domain-containing protein, putative [Eimeria tenella]CDJ43647.1 ZIP Zinc transporter domain-containing protein, putative [Eimeria tenella]|eukprot:XP_013234396.1 ZIP Zinc transporter domain-containing protein, putative [Eimeria tenella]